MIAFVFAIVPTLQPSNTVFLWVRVPCQKLRNQIWDQQGNAGAYGSNNVKPTPTTTEGEDTKKIVLDDTTDKMKKAVDTTPDNDTDKDLSAEGICILGICIGGDDGDDDDKPYPIEHKQKRFLQQFRGKKLLLDQTGCPIGNSAN